jgi:hypothetical protein
MGGPESGDNSRSVGVVAVEDILEHFGRKGMKWGVRGETSGSDSTNQKLSSGEITPSRRELKKILANNLKNPNTVKSVLAEKFLSTDKHPKEADTPIDPKDVVYNHGETGTGHQFADYHSDHKIVGESVFYRKYETGEKLYNVSKDGTGNDVALDANGSRVENHDKLKAYTTTNTRSASHSDPVVNILEHFGRKGMKWGVISETSADGSANIKLTTGYNRKGVVGIRTAGGSHQPASEDAKASATNKQIAKSSGLHALSNAELNKVISRMNLENSFTRLTTKPDSPAKAFIKKLLGDTGKTELTALSKGTIGPLAKSVDKGLASAYPSKGRHAVKLATTIVSPASGRHRIK